MSDIPPPLTTHPPEFLFQDLFLLTARASTSPLCLLFGCFRVDCPHFMASLSFSFPIGSDDSRVIQHNASLPIGEVLPAFFNRLFVLCDVRNSDPSPARSYPTCAK